MFQATIVCQGIIIRRIIEADSIDDARRCAMLETVADGFIVLNVSVAPI